MSKGQDIILTSEEITKKKFKEITLSKTDYLLLESKMGKHLNKYDFFDTVTPKIQGQHFLYQSFTGFRKSDDSYITISYPRLGTYLNAYPCDQTIEIEWVDHRRTWEWNFNISEYCFVAEDRAELQYMPLWGDQMAVYGVWDNMPDWKQLRQAYEKSWWFYRDDSELRDIQLNRILSGI